VPDIQQILTSVTISIWFWKRTS